MWLECYHSLQSEEHVDLSSHPSATVTYDDITHKMWTTLTAEQTADPPDAAAAAHRARDAPRHPPPLSDVG